MAYLKRPLHELVDKNEPGWPLVEEWIAAAERDVEVLPPSDAADAALVSLQVTTRSPMGAIVHGTGGLLIDSGWIRILGSGHARLPRSLPDWNFACGVLEDGKPPPYLLVGDDVLGGFFAINGGHFAAQGHTVWYFAPDRLEWEDTECTYSEFLLWSLSSRVDAFYEGQRWPGWRDEVAAVRGDQALSIYPFLFTEGPSIGERSRRPVPVRELFDMFVGDSLAAPG